MTSIGPEPGVPGGPDPQRKALTRAGVALLLFVFVGLVLSWTTAVVLAVIGGVAAAAFKLSTGSSDKHDPNRRA